MTSEFRYTSIDPISRKDATAAVSSGNQDELGLVALAVALHEPDVNWAQTFLISLVGNESPVVRGNAVQGLGHLARLHGKLDVVIARPVVVAALADPDPYVRGQAENAQDDLKVYLGVRIA
jgi:HEAT repeat protein